MSQEEQRVFLNAFNSIFFGMGIKDLRYVREVQFLLGPKDETRNNSRAGENKVQPSMATNLFIGRTGTRS
jgi:hypothetical protein